MNENSGYIKLFRKLENTEIWADPFKVKLWLLILFRCAYEEKDVLIGSSVIQLDKGQCIVGRKEIEEEFNKLIKSKKNSNFVSGSSLYRWLEVFENLQMLNIKKTNKYSIITVLNWSEYQNNEQQTNIKRTTSEQQMNNKRTSNAHKEEVKELKEVKEYKESISDDLFNSIVDFIEFRKSMKKPITNKSIPKWLDKLFELGKSDNERIAILNESIANGWQGIFPIKQNNQKSKREDVLPAYYTKGASEYDNTEFDPDDFKAIPSK